MSDDLTRWVTYLAFVALVYVAAKLAIRGAQETLRRARHIVNGPAIDAAMKRHSAGKGQDDPARVEQMAAIAEAEEAWDRDVWGGR